MLHILCDAVVDAAQRYAKLKMVSSSETCQGKRVLSERACAKGALDRSPRHLSAEPNSHAQAEGLALAEFGCWTMMLFTDTRNYESDPLPVVLEGASSILALVRTEGF